MTSPSLPRKSGAILKTLSGRGSRLFPLPIVPRAPVFSLQRSRSRFFRWCLLTGASAEERVIWHIAYFYLHFQAEMGKTLSYLSHFLYKTWSVDSLPDLPTHLSHRLHGKTRLHFWGCITWDSGAFKDRHWLELLPLCKCNCKSYNESRKIKPLRRMRPVWSVEKHDSWQALEPVLSAELTSANCNRREARENM